MVKIKRLLSIFVFFMFIIENIILQNFSSVIQAATLPEWTFIDIGSVASAGSIQNTNGEMSITSRGADIAGIDDQFSYAYKAVSGGNALSARIIAQGYSDASAKAGITFRETTATNSKFVALIVNPNNELQLLWRNSTGGSCFNQSIGNITLPVYIKLERDGNTFTAYKSANGVNWGSSLGSITVTMKSSLTAGMLVTAHSSIKQSTAKFDNISLNTLSPVSNTNPTEKQVPTTPTGLEGKAYSNSTIALKWTAFSDNTGVAAYDIYRNNNIVGSTRKLEYVDIGLSSSTSYSYTVKARDAAGNLSAASEEVTVKTTPLPAGWTTKDIGVVGNLGSAICQNGIYTLKGSGTDINGRSDGFQYSYTQVTGDYTIIADVSSIEKTNPSAKAGIMIRESTAPNSKNAFVALTPLSGVYFQWRSITGGETANAKVNGTAARYIKLSRKGNSFSAYQMSDGVNWIQIGSAKTITMNSSILIGLALTSHDNKKESVANFDDVSLIMPDKIAPSAPTGLKIASKTMNSITLSWSEATDNVGVTDYEVYKDKVLVGTTSNKTSFTVSKLNINTNYNFTVKARDAEGNFSASSKILSATTASDTVAPTVPKNLTSISKTARSVFLRWDPSTDNIKVDGYDVFQDGKKIGSTKGISFVCNNLKPNTTYSFSIKARDAYNNISEASKVLSLKTSEETCKILGQDIEEPLTLKGAATDDSIGLIWDKVQNATGYELKIDGNIVDVGAYNYYIHSNLAKSSSHTYCVRAKNSVETGNWSNEITITASISSTKISSNLTLDQDMVYGSLTIEGGTISLNGHNLLVVGGLTHGSYDTLPTINLGGGDLIVGKDLKQYYGNINVNGGWLNVLGNYNITGTSALLMNNNNDYVYVGGNFDTSAYKDTTKDFTAGVLEVKGNFTQHSHITSTGGEQLNFIATGTLVKFTSNNITQISFDYPNTYSNYFTNIDVSQCPGVIFTSSKVNVRNFSDLDKLKNTGDITFLRTNIQMQKDHSFNSNVEMKDGILNLNGNTLNITGNLTSTSAIYLTGGNLTIGGGLIEGNCSLSPAVDLAKGNLNIEGDLKQYDANININNGQLRVNKNYNISGSSTLLMTNSNDYVYIGGNFDTSAYKYTIKDFTAGVLEVKGNFTQHSHLTSTGGEQQNFIATGTLVKFTGNNITQISFDYPDTYTNYFTNIDVSQCPGVIFTSSKVNVRNFSDLDKLKNTGDITFLRTNIQLKKDHTFNSNVNIDLGNLNLNGKTLSIAGSLKSTSPISLSGGDLLIGGGLTQGYWGDFPKIDLGAGYLSVGGDLKQNDANINVNNGQLIVNGNYNITGTSRLFMTEDNDYVFVGKNFDENAYRDAPYDQQSDFTNGVLEVKGNFIQDKNENGTSGEGRNFLATNKHITLLSNNTGITQVTFDLSLPNCGFNILIITKPQNQYKFTYPASQYGLWNTLMEVDDVGNRFGAGNGADAATGNYSKNFTDFNIPSAGDDIVFSRSYNSLDTKNNSGFGKGWSFSYACNMKDFANGNTKGKVVTLPDGSSQYFTVNKDGTYTANDSRNTLTKDSSNGTFELKTKDQHTFSFNSKGYLASISDKNGNETSIDVDDSGKVHGVTDYANRKYIITYNSDGLIESITDSEHRVVKYVYDNNKLVQSIDPNNIITRYSYDSNGRMSEIRDNDKKLIESVTYIPSTDTVNGGKIDTTTDAYGNTKTYAYDMVNQKTTITDSENRQSVQYYDSSFNIIKSEDAEHKFTMTDYYKNKYGLDYSNEERTVTDRNGNTTQYIRDDRGNITTQINPDASTKEFVYDDKNNVIQEKDENGNLTFYTYDSDKKLLLEKSQPLNGSDIYQDGCDKTKFAITKYTYYTDKSIKGLVKTITDPENHTTTYDYDNYGYVNKIIDARGKTTSILNNSIGWKDTETSPRQYLTSYKYDNDGNLIKTETKEINEANRYYISRTIYDETGRKSKEISGNQYDASLDDLDKDIYSGDVGTRYTYYDYGKVDTVTDAEGNKTAYTYDIYGNVKTETKPNGAIYRYEYDDLNRQTNIWFRENSTTPEILLQKNSYDILGNRNTEKKETIYLNDTETATTTYIYDYAGRLIEKDNPEGTSVKTEYYPDGNKKSYTDENGKATYYSIDGLSRPSETWTPFEERSDGKVYYAYSKIQYDKAGNKHIEKMGKTLVLAKAIPTAFKTVTYLYNEDNKVTSITDNEGRKTEYQYDDDGYVSKEDKYYAENKKYTTEYLNNFFGKPITKTVHVSAGDLKDNKFDDTTDKTIITQYTHDSNGNVLTEQSPDRVKTTYSYDNLNRLVSVSYPGFDENDKSTIIKTSKTYNWEGKEATVTDARKNTTVNTYDKRGFLQKQVNPKQGTSYYYYDRAGRKIAEVSPNNYVSGAEIETMNRTEYSYDLMGRIKTKTEKYKDPVTGEDLSIVVKAYKYDAKGNIIKELDALGYEAGGTSENTDDNIEKGYGTSYTYNLAGKLTSELDAVSQDRGLQFTKRYSYDALGRKITETNAKGNIISYTYNDAGNVLTQTIRKTSGDSESLLQTNTYDYLGNLLTQRDGNGNITSFSYNGLGKVRQTIYPGDDTIPVNTISYQYDSMGNQVFKQDSTGNTHIYTFDHAGRILADTESKADGTDKITKSTKYDVNGNKRYEKDGKGNTKETIYDELNKPIQVIVKVTVNQEGTMVTIPKKTIYRYDANGNNATITDWRNNTITNLYDPLNRLYEKKDAYGKVIQSLQYYHNGTQSKSTDALDHSTTYQYDKNNRLLSTTDALQQSTSQTYDNCGNIDSKTDGENHTTKFDYDELNRLVTVVNAKNEVTSYTYDLNNNMLTQKDGKGNVATFEYNAANKLKERVDAGGVTGTPGNLAYDSNKSESYTYDAEGNLKTKKDRNGVVTTYNYDIHGRMLTETAGSISISYTYDNNGNMLTMKDGTGITERTYDELNRVTSKTVPSIGRTEYIYDKIDNTENSAVISDGGYAEVTIDPKGNQTTKVYDRVERLKEVYPDASKKTVYNYYDNGNVQRIVYPDGSSENYTYYEDNTLNTLVNSASDNQILETYEYTYYKNKNIKAKEDSKGITTYAYDAVNRLEAVTEPSGKLTTYTYDAAGNRETETVNDKGVTIKNVYSYNEQNRLDTITTNQGSSAVETISYNYDKNGNQLKETKTINASGATKTELTTNTFDELNQLISTKTPDGKTVNNTYNAEGLRVTQSVDGVSTNYLYEEDKVILELDGQGNEKARNVQGTNLLSRIVTSKDASSNTVQTTGYYMYNGHADVTNIIDNNSKVLNSYYYDSFGNLTENKETIDNPYKYAGYQYDSETSTYYLNSRMYDPETARFLQEDTYRGQPNDPLSLNLYTYCANDPLIYDDPTGHWFEFLKTLKNLTKSAIDTIDNAVDSVVNTIDDAMSDASDYINNKVDSGFGYIENKFGISDKNPVYSLIKNQIKRKIGEYEGRIKGTVDIAAGLLSLSIKSNPLTNCLKSVNTALDFINDPKKYIDQAKQLTNTIYYAIENPEKVGKVLEASINYAGQQVLAYGKETINNPYKLGDIQGQAEVFVASFFVGGGEARTAVKAEEGIGSLERVVEEASNSAITGDARAAIDYKAGDLYGGLVDESKAVSSKGAAEATKSPGIVQSRINIANGQTRFTPLRPTTGEPVSAGFEHVVKGHFDRPLANSRSVFSIYQDELKSILQRPDVVKSPVRAIEGGQYVRTVNTGDVVGNTALKFGGNETTWIDIYTDKAGNLITTYPVPGK